MNELLHKFVNETDGFEVHVTEHEKGYAVSIYDLDACEYFPSVQIFPSELWAVGVAKSIAEGKEYDHSQPVTLGLSYGETGGE